MNTPAVRSVPWVGIAVLLGAALAWALRDILVLGGLAVLLAYALDPFVSRLEQLPLPRKRHLPRALAASIVMLLVAAGAAGLMYLTLPRLATEFGRFLERIPGSLERLLTAARDYAMTHGLGRYFEPGPNGATFDPATIVQYVAQQAGGWLGTLFGSADSVLGLSVLPLLSFYLLAEPHWAARGVLRFVPEGHRDTANRAIAAADNALSSYVRGQAVVCLTVGGFTAIALAMLGIPLSFLLGVIACLAEVLPFIGAAISITAIGLVGFGSSTMDGVFGILAYVGVNTASSYLVTPRVMNRYLELHPFVVILSVLAGGRLLGPPGVVVALPIAAVVHALIKEFGPPAEESGAPAGPVRRQG